MSIVPVYDSIHANVDKLPPGQRAAGYTTGSSIIQWTAADWKSHPGAVRICQDPGGSDETADAFDVESFAGRNGDAAGWYQRALSSYVSGKRPGQRRPAIYTSAANVTALVNALIAGGVKSGPRLWVAHWGETDADARAAVRNAEGPFPVIGVQNHSFNADDESWMSESWLETVSVTPSAPGVHRTKAGDTLGGLADSRNMTIWTWLGHQRDLNPADAMHLVRHASPEPGSTWRTTG